MTEASDDFGPRFDLEDNDQSTETQITNHQSSKDWWLGLAVRGGLILVCCFVVLTVLATWQIHIQSSYLKVPQRLSKQLEREVADSKDELAQGKLIFEKRALTQSEVQNARNSLDALEERIKQISNEAKDREQEYRDRYRHLRSAHVVESFTELRAQIEESKEDLARFRRWWDSLSTPLPAAVN